jgi:hypothetical protein
LPDFPITWIPIGVCVETPEADFNYQNLADLVSKITLPQMTVSVINIPELIEEVVISILVIIIIHVIATYNKERMV